MILGMSLTTFTLVHTIISLIAIVAGLVAMAGLLGSRSLPGWTALFLVTTILTSATGFLFPFFQLLPSHIVGIISLVLLAAAVIAYYGFRQRGYWRAGYVVTAMLSLYLNVFVLIVQAFQKIGPLRDLAPNQNEPPFLAAQAIALLMLVAAIVVGLRRGGPAPRFA
ncbi:conserved hypothetical protein [Rhodopseudomonas palustris HaA2]|uniref:Uncharacterized protein n=1 Tax=Rhodopseudomonas palustris (strain HaA2) TaxID=316058 RepID=Q2IRW8_RHOP2|nr:hypothetical protein [Rhodopseudomonas palustris]ABD09042.1 conserved hypothetical protein [Rhodopseudomonas palustris HaA2]